MVYIYNSIWKKCIMIVNIFLKNLYHDNILQIYSLSIYISFMWYYKCIYIYAYIYIYICIAPHCVVPKTPHSKKPLEMSVHVCFRNTLPRTAPSSTLCYFCYMLQHTATRCNTNTHTLHYSHTLTTTNYHTLQHTATHCNTLQHSATHSNTLQHTATHVYMGATLSAFPFSIDLFRGRNNNRVPANAQM